VVYIDLYKKPNANPKIKKGLLPFLSGNPAFLYARFLLNILSSKPSFKPIQHKDGWNYLPILWAS